MCFIEKRQSIYLQMQKCCEKQTLNLVKMWKNRYLHTLLVEMWNGTTTLKTCVYASHSTQPLYLWVFSEILLRNERVKLLIYATQRNLRTVAPHKSIQMKKECMSHDSSHLEFYKTVIENKQIQVACLMGMGNRWVQGKWSSWWTYLLSWGDDVYWNVITILQNKQEKNRNRFLVS
jgi:hypothetical protein